MDFPDNWEVEMAQLLDDHHPVLVPTTTTTTTTTTATEDPQPDSPTIQDTLDLQLISPKPPALARWSTTHFNKPGTDMERGSLPRLMKKSEMEETRNFELYRLHSIAFELNKGDTLVFIDYPIPKKAALSHSDCNGIIFKPLEFRVNSANLVGKFSEMLAPTYQFRILRRLKLVNKLPDGIKYVLDLTPPSEGDELVFQMTELSLPPGIIKWWSSSLLNSVDPWLVCGHDDICGCKRQNPEGTYQDEPHAEDSSSIAPQNAAAGIKGKDYPKLPIGPEAALVMKARGDDELYETPAYRKVPDYCPIRHRNGILRLLLLLEGKGVILDSAIRVWTLVKLGVIFDCANVLRDRVAQWIMHGPNTALIERLPEEALQIAFALELPEVGQSAFRILVNEAALKLAAPIVDKGGVRHFAMFGRKEGDLPDDLRNLVQHGAIALVERVTRLHSELQNPDLFDFWNIEEWNKLREIEKFLENEKGVLNGKALSSVRLLMKALVHEVQSAYDAATAKTLNYVHPVMNSVDHDLLALDVPPSHFEKTSVIMSKMSPIQLLLCSITYNEFGTLLDDRRYRDCKCKLPGLIQTTYRQLTNEAFVCLRDAMLFWEPEIAQTAGLTPYIQKWLARDPAVWLDCIERGVKNALRPMTLSWLRHDIEPPLNLTRHLLLTLTNDELKYLPLWAGGCDDGSGGVFESRPLVPASMGPSGPGPAYHTGMTIPSAPSSETEFITEDMNALRMWGSNTGASIDVHDSISTVYNPNRVISDDQSIASESFTEGRSEDYQEARFVIPADHQGVGTAVDLTVEAADSDIQSVTEGRNSSDDEQDFDDQNFDYGNDEDMHFWDSDSDDSVDTVMV